MTCRIAFFLSTTFGELQDYVPKDTFLKAIFEAKIPLNEDGDYWVYTCIFLNLERAEEYFY